LEDEDDDYDDELEVKEKCVAYFNALTFSNTQMCV
jgi:hypothetical protein